MSWNVLGKLFSKIREAKFAKNTQYELMNQIFETKQKQINDLMRIHAERHRKIECKGGFLQTMEYLRLSPQM